MDGIALDQPATQDSGTRTVAFWLLACCALVAAMVLLGGLTRLTGSGLSMVEWKPLTLLPPLTDADWQAEFANYRQSPQFRLVNADMTIAGFKGIFWLEYLHRLLGRAVGAVFLLPFLVFLWQRRIAPPLAWRLAGLFALGGLQGLVGWLMVKSGLIDRPEVSQYRLAAHLGLAVAIFTALLWTALDLLRGPACAPLPGARRTAVLLTLVLLTILAGAFVAGLDAGLVYNSFPLMDGRIVPEAYGQLSPWWHDAFENVASVQFHHRLLALATLTTAVGLWALDRRQPPLVRRAQAAVALAATAQAALGIATLLLVVPVPLASLHQAGALVTLALTLTLLHLQWRPAVSRRRA